MNGNPKELVFEHVLYEFEMYLHSDSIRKSVIECSGVNSGVIYNMAIESHQLHLRNLIEFFCQKGNTIRMEEILAVEFRLDEKPLGSTYTTICQAVDHLSPTRATKDLTSACKTAMKVAFPIIVAKIREFLIVISNPQNVQSKYHSELSTEYIVRRINDLKTVIKRLCMDGDNDA